MEFLYVGKRLKKQPIKPFNKPINKPVNAMNYLNIMHYRDLLLSSCLAFLLL